LPLKADREGWIVTTGGRGWRGRIRPRRAPPLPTRPATFHVRVVTWLRNRYITGIAFLAPFIITWIIFDWLYGLGSRIFRPLFQDWFGHTIPGLGFAILVLGPFLIGTIALWVFGQRLLFALGAIVTRIPVIGTVFGVSQQFVASLGPGGETGFQRVVEIEYPRRGLWAIGFLTDVVERDEGELMGVVYVPTAPTPNSGWLAVVPVADINDVDMTVNDAIRYALSGGVAAPDKIVRTPLVTADWPPPASDAESPAASP
jgi:uncharacterized membrane protein